VKEYERKRRAEESKLFYELEQLLNGGDGTNSEAQATTNAHGSNASSPTGSPYNNLTEDPERASYANNTNSSNNNDNSSGSAHSLKRHRKDGRAHTKPQLLQSLVEILSSGDEVTFHTHHCRLLSTRREAHARTHIDCRHISKWNCVSDKWRVSE
jgi:hypothetical protein